MTVHVADACARRARARGAHIATDCDAKQGKCRTKQRNYADDDADADDGKMMMIMVMIIMMTKTTLMMKMVMMKMSCLQ